MEYEIVEERGMFVVYSIAPTRLGGTARNYIAERESRALAEGLIADIKKMDI